MEKPTKGKGQTERAADLSAGYSMIEVKHLTKHYGTFCALDDVSFSVGKGEVVGLLGPNGAGKSTAMNILTGCLSATCGEVFVGGADMREEPLKAKRMLGYLPEQPPLYPDMTVGEYLRFVYELKGCDLPRDAHLAEICELVRIGDVFCRLISQLSKGYRQRVGIAQALIGDPGLVILDEPTVGLDPKQIIEVRALIRTLSRRHTVLLSTHILAEVQAVCNRVLIINRGKLIADEQTDTLTRMIEDGICYRYGIVGPQKDVLPLLRRVPGVKEAAFTGEYDGEAGIFRLTFAPGADCRKAVYYACAKAGFPILSAVSGGGDLESVFIRLVDNSENHA